MFHAQLAIPESFSQCFTYEQQIMYLVRWLEEMADAIGGPGSPAIDTLNEAVEKINKTLEELQQSLNLYVTVEAFDAFRDTDADEKKVINETIEALKTQLNELIGGMDKYALKTDLNALSESVDKIINDLGKTYATKSELKTAVDAINGELVTVKGNISGINTRIDGIEEEIEALRNSIPDISDIKNIKNAIMASPAIWQVGGEGWLQADGYDSSNLVEGGPYSESLDYFFGYSRTAGNTGNPVYFAYRMAEAERENIQYTLNQLKTRMREVIGQRYMSSTSLSEDGTYFNPYQVKNGEGVVQSGFTDIAIMSGAASVSWVINYLIYALTCAGCDGRSKDHKALVDTMPTADSKRLVESGGVKAYVDQAVANVGGGTGGGGNITIDAVPTNKSTNAVSSGGTYTAINEVKGIAESALTVAAEAKNEAEDNATGVTQAKNAAAAAMSAAEAAEAKAQQALDQGGGSGTPGAAAGFGTVTATVDDSVGVPSVDVSTSGPDTAKNFSFEFHNLKGADGQPGAPGEDGESAGFGTVSAIVDDTTGTPSVDVSVSGPNTAKNISFSFHGLKGESGEGGSGGANSIIPNQYTVKDLTFYTDGTKVLYRHYEKDIFLSFVSGAETKFRLYYDGNVYEMSTDGNYAPITYDVCAYKGEMYLIVFASYNGVWRGAITTFMICKLGDTSMTIADESTGSLITNVIGAYPLRDDSGVKFAVVRKGNIGIYEIGEQLGSGVSIIMSASKNENCDACASNGVNVLVYYDGTIKLYGIGTSFPVGATLPQTTLQLLNSDNTDASIEYMSYDGTQYIATVSNTAYSIPDKINDFDANMKALYSLDSAPTSNWFGQNVIRCGPGWLQVDGRGVNTKDAYLTSFDGAEYMQVYNNCYKVVSGYASHVMFPGKDGGVTHYPVISVVQPTGTPNDPFGEP